MKTDETTAIRRTYERRSPEGVATIFEYFADVECPQLDAHLYAALCRGVAKDADLLEMAARAPVTQPPPNLLFAAVHYLLLGGADHELRDWYPLLSDGTARDPASAFPAFRDFCLAHRERIEGLIETRLTQTNVIQRCSVLLPGFSRVSAAAGGRPLALIEIGPSAGLNQRWDRFRYAYRGVGEGVDWGDPGSAVLVECELRGDRGLPPLAAVIPVASRCGVDINPVDIRDDDAVQWLRALVWPDHEGRQERLTGAIDVARKHPSELHRGDAAERLPALIEAAPADAHVCVYGTHTLYQFPDAALHATLSGLQAASRSRPVDLLSVEGTGDRCSELTHTVYREGERDTSKLARCNPHGRWLEWIV